MSFLVNWNFFRFHLIVQGGVGPRMKLVVPMEKIQPAMLGYWSTCSKTCLFQVFES